MGGAQPADRVKAPAPRLSFSLALPLSLLSPTRSCLRTAAAARCRSAMPVTRVLALPSRRSTLHRRQSFASPPRASNTPPSAMVSTEPSDFAHWSSTGLAGARSSVALPPPLSLPLDFCRDSHRASAVERPRHFPHRHSVRNAVSAGEPPHRATIAAGEVASELFRPNQLHQRVHLVMVNSPGSISPPGTSPSARKRRSTASSAATG